MRAGERGGEWERQRDRGPDRADICTLISCNVKAQVGKNIELNV